MRTFTIINLAIFFLAVITFSPAAYSQRKAPDFHHVEPPFWWTGMKTSTIQILFHHQSRDIGAYTATVEYPGVRLTETKKTENAHYIFLTLEISSNASAGMVPIVFRDGKKSIRYQYELRSREGHENGIQGFGPSDVVYLIMPDRFSNGDEKNDSIPGMFEGAHRTKDFGRHGGDLKGISDHLDYVKELGVTAIWLNPVLENNQKTSSYHGYAITDLYQVDRRFGGNEAYLSFISKSHELGLKVIQDMVMNHIGDQHWLVLDPPDKTWIHQFPQFTRSNYRGTVVSDPYRSQMDETLMSNGWFDTTMPDVDQTNSMFARYLIQNSIWWIEYAGIDGIRMDTYPYPDKDFMAEWAKRLSEEYPKFKVVGEVWLNNVATSAYWAKDMVNKDGYKSYLTNLTDFPFYNAVMQGLNEEGGWDSGLNRIYNVLSQDFIYPDASSNLTFLDNHDLTRFYRSCGRNINKFKLGMALLLTTRGIPQIYYGSELAMDGDGGHHPDVRRDFPGGWKGDTQNAFTAEGRSTLQNESFNFMKTILNWRKDQPVIHNGKLTHYVPEENVYVYFRHNDDKRVMVILNGSTSEKRLRMERYQENIGGSRQGRDVISNKTIALDSLVIPPLTPMIIELSGN